jgi:phytoene dehydrogenase-like protein
LTRIENDRYDPKPSVGQRSEQRRQQRIAEGEHEGSYVTVDMSRNQMGPNRPTPALAGYRTPIEGLWHTGAAAHPMGGVHGWVGRTTARTVLKSSRS